MTTLKACYDLTRCPPTYDAVAFLALLELERRRIGADDIDLYIHPGPAEGFRRDNLWPYTTEDRVALRDNVLIPLCWMLPTVRSVTVDGSSAWGRGEYHVGLHNILRALRHGCRPLQHQDRVGQNPHMITFTLREAEHHPLRNSRCDEWRAAADVLCQRGYRVVLIRDTARAAEVADEPCSDEVVLDLRQRANLYASTSLNVGVSNGPMWMSIFMNAPTLMLRPTTNEAGGCYDDAFYAKCGLRRGEQLPTSPPHQRLVWEEDRCDVIVRAVEEMMEAVW